MTADQDDPIVEQAIEETALELASIVALNLPEGFPGEETVRRLSPILRALVAKVREPLLYTSDKQAVAWKERAMKAEADLAAARAERDEARQQGLVSIKGLSDYTRRIDNDWKAECDREVATMRAREEALREALERIAVWELPRTGSFACGGRNGIHAEDCNDARTATGCHEYSYSLEYGSNGEREHFREVARSALSSPGTVAPTPEATSAPTERP